MTGAYDEDQLVRSLRLTSRDSELDAGRIWSIVENGVPTGPVRTLPGVREILTNPVRSFKPGRRRRPGARPHRTVQVFALPIAAALATMLVIVINDTGVPKSDTIEKAIGKSDTVTRPPTPTVTSRLAPPVTVTASPTAAASSSASTATPSATAGPAGGDGTTAGQGSRVTVTVTPAPQGRTYSLPQHRSIDWFAVESNGAQAHSVSGNNNLGPAQIGSGQTSEAGPFSVNWVQGSASTDAGGAQTWVLVPGSVRGAASSIKIPARLRQVPATITLLTGTTGGTGKLSVGFVDPAGGRKTVQASLPSCSASRCPAVVTIKLGSSRQVSRNAEVMIELTADGADAKVGLAAAELD